jgi:23S rRNA (uracil1939-C5)-methyltransferase
MMLRHLGGHLRAGFYAPHSNDLVAAERCPVQDPRLNAALDAARAALDEPGLSSWRGADRPGLLRALLLRIDPATAQGLLTIVASRDEPRLTAIAKGLVSIQGIGGVFLNVNPSDGGAVLGPQTRHLAGARRQEVTFGPLTLEVGPTAFLQTHHAAGAALVEVVSDLVGPTVGHLADLYAGVGVFGLSLMGRAERVTLVESSQSAVADARHNAARLSAPHVTTQHGDAAELTPRLVAAADPPDVVVLDPPRAGCRPPVVEALAGAGGPRRIVYVSCNPVSLARDLAVLVAGGLRITDIVPVDMFPHTHHVEVVVALSRGPVDAL